MNKIINGKKYYVADYSVLVAEKNENVRTAIGTDSNGDHHFECKGYSSHSTIWGYFVEIPEPKIIPWTVETYPLDKLIIQRMGSCIYLHISRIALSGVITPDQNFLTYDELCKYYLVVNLDRTTSPCGEVVGE